MVESYNMEAGGNRSPAAMGTEDPKHRRLMMKPPLFTLADIAAPAGEAREPAHADALPQATARRLRLDRHIPRSPL
jgi:hypothetical protein